MKYRKHLSAYETLWINCTKGCCNIRPPVSYLQKVRRQEYSKEYYVDNKPKIAERNKEYREANKEKEYREANKPEINAYNKEYYQANKTKIAEYKQANKTKIAERRSTKVTCECGCVVTKNSLSRHKKTKKHLQLMASK